MPDKENREAAKAALDDQKTKREAYRVGRLAKKGQKRMGKALESEAAGRTKKAARQKKRARKPLARVDVIVGTVEMKKGKKK